MKKKSPLRSGITFLIAAVLFVVSFFRGPEEPWLLGGIFAVWAIRMLIALLLSPLRIRFRADSDIRKVQSQADDGEEDYALGSDDIPTEQAPDSDYADESRPIDPEAWYSLQGKTMLESCIAELYSRGHTDLTIKENGDICILQADSEVIYDTLGNMPARSFWQTLLKVFEGDGLAASVTEEGIILSW